MTGPLGTGTVWLVWAAALMPSSVLAQGPWPLRQMTYLEAASTDDRAEPSRIEWLHGPWEELLDLPTLRDYSIPAGAREVRLWVSGPGPIIPSVLVRLTDLDGATSGEVVLVWSQETELFGGNSALPEFEALMAAPLGERACRSQQNGMTVTHVHLDRTQTASRQWSAACYYGPSRLPTDWSAVMRELDRLGLETLPEWDYEAELAQTGSVIISHVVDGVLLDVETISGSRYHAFSWSNPDHREGEAARAADQMIEIVLGIKRELQASIFGNR